MNKINFIKGMFIVLFQNVMLIYFYELFLKKMIYNHLLLNWNQKISPFIILTIGVVWAHVSVFLAFLFMSIKSNKQKKGE